MAESSFKTADGLRFRCPGCGGRLHYNIRESKLVCESCANVYEVASIPDPSRDAEDNCMDTVEYVCPSCGATLHTSQTAATSFCSYCGSDVVLSERLARIERPAKIVPFKVTREEAENIYRERLSESRYIPGDMLAQETMDLFRPVYIPYWRYSFDAKGNSEGRGIKRYSDSSYNYEDEYDYQFDGEIHLTGLLYDASSAFEDDTAQKLRFSMKESVPFHPAYLCGMYAEAADTADVVYAKALESLAEEKYRKLISGKTGTEGAFDLPAARESSAELVMMPVWLLANRQGERVLYTAINGASGKIVCDPPVSASRFALLTAGLFAAILAALLLITHWVVVRPNLVLMCCGILAAVFMRQIVPAMDKILIQRTLETDPTRAMKRKSPGGDQPLTDVVWSEEGRKRLEEERKRLEKERKEEEKRNRKPNLVERIDGFMNSNSCLGLFLIILVLPVLLGGFFILLFLPFILASERIGGSGSSAILAYIISDQSVLPPYALAVSFIMLLSLKYTYRKLQADPDRKKAGTIDWLILVALRALMVIGLVVVLVPVPGVKFWYYGLSIAILVLLVVSMLRLNRSHNEFVTRPVPFFGKEEQA